MEEPDLMGLAPPHQFRGLGYLIIEMDMGMAQKLIDDRTNNSIWLELFSDSVFICDNE